MNLPSNTSKDNLKWYVQDVASNQYPDNARPLKSFVT